MVASSITQVKPNKINGKYVTREFIDYTKFLILQSLITVYKEHKNKYGELVICVDKSVNGYWRHDVFPGYKENRSKNRDESDVDFKEVFQELNGLMEQLVENVPWKVVVVDRAEADDIMLALARLYNKDEPILIHSPDKDMIQAQRGTDNVQQYSSLTRKWIVPETKHESMEEWITEHVCLGDASDGVPRVIDHTEFSDNFLRYLEDLGVSEKTPLEFKNSDMTLERKKEIISGFNIFKKDRKGEDTYIKDIYRKDRFGASGLKKAIEKHGSLDAWLDSHPLYRANYERNYTLVMEEGIPDYIIDAIVKSFREAKTEYNDKVFEDYLKSNNLNSIILELPNVFKINRELTIDDFDW